MVQVVALCYGCRRRDCCPVYQSLDDLCRMLNESILETSRDFFGNELPELLPVVETCEKFKEGYSNDHPHPVY